LRPPSAIPSVCTADARCIDGFVAPGFEGVTEEFARNLEHRNELGAAFAAVVDGVPVVDLWGGLSDPHRIVPWRRDTLVCIFSGTKGLVATCLLILLERGKLELDAPVCRYWPEFAAAGKEGIRVRHVVSHQAGLPGLAVPVTADDAADHVRMAALLADQAPVHEPGSRLWYHAMTFGWLCGELVRRVDGRTLGGFFREEVAARLGLDAWIGLPEEYESRVAVLVPAAEFGERRSALPDAEDNDIASSIWMNPPRFSADPLPANTPLWHRAEIPASNALATARAVALLYGCLANGGTVDGIQLLQPHSIERGTTLLSRGVDPYLEEEFAFGVGFQLQTPAGRFGPVDDAFGHPGVGGSVHGAWPATRTGFSYVTNAPHASAGHDPRADALLTALAGALGATSFHATYRRTAGSQDDGPARWRR
jgi:CubicO group peptidase (beta-lactamase class C family)